MKTKKTLAGISVSILATLALLICTASSARAADDGDKKPATSAPSDTGPSDGDYCTVLYSTKLQGELKLTDAQQETIGKLKDRLKAMLENAANPARCMGRPTREPAPWRNAAARSCRSSARRSRICSRRSRTGS